MVLDYSLNPYSFRWHICRAIIPSATATINIKTWFGTTMYAIWLLFQRPPLLQLLLSLLLFSWALLLLLLMWLGVRLTKKSFRDCSLPFSICLFRSARMHFDDGILWHYKILLKHCFNYYKNAPCAQWSLNNMSCWSLKYRQIKRRLLILLLSPLPPRVTSFIRSRFTI